MITIKQIAESLNMSATTVSNVIHGKTGEVSRETIDRVQRYLDEVEYIPNINARNLAQNHSNIIGIVLKTNADRYSHILCDPFVSEMLGGIERIIREHGFYTMVYISDEITEIINRVASWNVDGLLLFWMQNDDAIRVYKRFKKPVVYIDTYVNWDSIEKIGQTYINVGLTDEDSTYDAVSYLIDKGHRRIAFVSERKEGVNQRRFDGYRRALKDAGIEFVDKYFFEFDTTAAGIDKCLDEIPKKARDVTAIFCCSDNIAGMVMNTCFKHGLDVPGDVSIMGFDDNINNLFFRPSLTTVHQDIEKKGVVAAEKLIDMVHGEIPAKHQITLSSYLVERDTIADINKNNLRN